MSATTVSVTATVPLPKIETYTLMGYMFSVHQQPLRNPSFRDCRSYPASGNNNTVYPHSSAPHSRLLIVRIVLVLRG